jgi:hypothetical protein
MDWKVFDEILRQGVPSSYHPLPNVELEDENLPFYCNEQRGAGSNMVGLIF